MGSPMRSLLLLGLAVLAACQPLVVQDLAARRYVPLTGGTLELHRELTVGPGTAHTYLQWGEVVGGRNLYAPSCSLEVTNVLESRQSIRPDRFAIVSAGIGRDEYLTSLPLRLASVEIGAGMGGFWAGRDNGATMVMDVIEMRLDSARQPNVLNLTCRSALDDPARVERLTLQDMQAALGPIATLHPAANSLR